MSAGEHVNYDVIVDLLQLVSGQRGDLVRLIEREPRRDRARRKDPGPATR